jgi:hypothetical protein
VRRGFHVSTRPTEYFAEHPKSKPATSSRTMARIRSTSGTVKFADSETEFGNNLASESAGWTLKSGVSS